MIIVSTGNNQHLERIAPFGRRSPYGILGRRDRTDHKAQGGKML